MMTGLDIAFAAMLGLQAANPAVIPVVEMTCEAQPMPEINVVWSSDTISYDNSKTQDQLSKMPIDTKSPYSSHVVTKVGGLMQGGLEVTTNMNISKISNPLLKQNCLWLKEIRIELHINPTIFIAKEYPKDSCMFNAVLEHEMKHIKVDREIAIAYQEQLRSMAGAIAQQIGVVGPKHDIEVGITHKKIIRYVEDNMTKVTEFMYAQRRKVQQMVDTFEEYERVQKKCGRGPYANARQ